AAARATNSPSPLEPRSAAAQESAQVPVEGLQELPHVRDVGLGHRTGVAAVWAVQVELLGGPWRRLLVRRPRLSGRRSRLALGIAHQRRDEPLGLAVGAAHGHEPQLVLVAQDADVVGVVGGLADGAAHGANQMADEALRITHDILTVGDTRRCHPVRACRGGRYLFGSFGSVLPPPLPRSSMSRVSMNCLKMVSFSSSTGVASSLGAPASPSVSSLSKTMPA